MLTASLAWYAGRWAPPAELALPLDDRGLLLADGLFETLLIEAGSPRLLDEHLLRWQRSAALLAMAPPPGRAVLDPLIAEAIERLGLGTGAAALRLNWSRGDGGGAGRGIDLPTSGPSAELGRFWLQLTPLQPRFGAITAIVSQVERRNAHSLLSRCKTFAYGQAIQARLEARRAGAEDALLLSSAGGLCCGTTATLMLRRGGTWLTPPLSSGCLPGVMRARALQLGLAREEPLEPHDLTRNDGPAVLLNSLGCQAIRALDGRPLAPGSDYSTEAFFRDLLDRCDR